MRSTLSSLAYTSINIIITMFAWVTSALVCMSSACTPLKDYLLEDIMARTDVQQEKYDENSAILSQTSMNSYTSNIALTMLTGVERSP